MLILLTVQNCQENYKGFVKINGVTIKSLKKAVGGDLL